MECGIAGSTQPGACRLWPAWANANGTMGSRGHSHMQCAHMANGLVVLPMPSIGWLGGRLWGHFVLLPQLAQHATPSLDASRWDAFNLLMWHSFPCVQVKDGYGIVLLSLCTLMEQRVKVGVKRWMRALFFWEVQSWMRWSPIFLPLTSKMSRQSVHYAFSSRFVLDSLQENILILIAEGVNINHNFLNNEKYLYKRWTLAREK